MSQTQPRPSTPRTGHSNVPWFTTRVVSLLLAWCWGIIGAASGKQYFPFFITERFSRELIQQRVYRDQRTCEIQ